MSITFLLSNEQLSKRTDNLPLAVEQAYEFIKKILKADYISENDGEKIYDAALTAVLTELKGVNVPKALNQLKGTLLLYKNVFCKFGHVYARAIAASSTPNLKASPEYVNLERMIRKDYKGNWLAALFSFYHRRLFYYIFIATAYSILPA